MRCPFYVYLLAFAFLAPTVCLAGALDKNVSLTSAWAQPLSLKGSNTTLTPGGSPQIELQPSFSGVQTDTTPGSIEATREGQVLGRRQTVTGRMERRADVAASDPGIASLDSLPVFGAPLFNGNFTSTYYDERNPSYAINLGDRISIRIWGVFNFEQTLTVDLQGNIFIPSVGPVSVAGVTLADLPGTVRAAVNTVYSEEYYESYIDLAIAQPMSVMVTGNVMSPGRYAGGASDSVLCFLDLAGGIDFSRGSYRNIQIVRKGVIVDQVDLYEFIKTGFIGKHKLQQGDVIVVGDRGMKIGVNGRARTQAWFEFSGTRVTGAEVMKWAEPLPGVTDVSVLGYRNQQPLKAYLTLDEFASFNLCDDDTVEFIRDKPAGAITVYVEGAIEGRSQFFVKKGVRLLGLLDYIAIDPAYANPQALYLKRASVARQQEAALKESLYRLEQSALTSSSDSVDEANIRVQEASQIKEFVARALQLEQQGVVAVTMKGKTSNVYLQDGDIIHIPNKTDVVLLAGQVVAPNAIIYQEDYKVDDYVKLAGGYGRNADMDNVLLFKADGHIYNSTEVEVAPGDTIMVMPRFEDKNLQFAKDLTQIFFQLAVGTRALVDIF